jgi:hypothetical protein
MNSVPSNPIFYYAYNKLAYTSSDAVKFTSSAGAIIYYLENGITVPASAVTTDSNSVLWTKLGLMSVQVYNPSIFTISYNNTNYTLYWSDTTPMLTNGIYSNGTNYLYQDINNNWYVSTDKITFNKIILDANQNPTETIYTL